MNFYTFIPKLLNMSLTASVAICVQLSSEDYDAFIELLDASM